MSAVIVLAVWSCVAPFGAAAIAYFAGRRHGFEDAAMRVVDVDDGQVIVSLRRAEIGETSDRVLVQRVRA